MSPRASSLRRQRLPQLLLVVLLTLALLPIAPAHGDDPGSHPDVAAGDLGGPTLASIDLLPFSDVPPTSAHARAVGVITGIGIANGYPDGLFRPDRAITRAQMATFLTQGFALDAASQPTFPDVPSTSTHARSISAIAAEGITTGYPDGTFRPDLPVSRGQMASFLARALGLPDAPSPGYPDVPPTSAHARAIASIAAEGITTGYPDGTFRPGLAVSRGQMASFLARALGIVTPAEFRACMVADPGGLDDASFNQTAYTGLVDAWRDLPIDIAVREASFDDLTSDIDAFVAQDCDVIITVGFLFDAPSRAAAQAHPDQRFAIIDPGGGAAPANLRLLTFAVDEAAFLAGYVAAAVTDTGTVATYGGVQIPAVTDFMDGFLAGVRYHDQVEGSAVEVLGWDGSAGRFAGSFTDTSASRTIADELLQEGADVLLPVLGPAGSGAAAAITEHGSGRLIWVDTDGYEVLPQYRSILLTSVLKRMDVAVNDTVTDAFRGSFTGGERLGTLANDGVGIAPFHDLADDVPPAVTDALEEVISGIIDGTISVDPADY